MNHDLTRPHQVDDGCLVLVRIRPEHGVLPAEHLTPRAQSSSSERVLERLAQKVHLHAHGVLRHEERFHGGTHRFAGA